MNDFRNVFEFELNPEYWKKATQDFPNKIPRFHTKEEAIAFTRQFCHIGSNPEEPILRHSISTFTTWKQIQNHILPVLLKHELMADLSIEEMETLKRDNRYMKEECDDSMHTSSNSTQSVQSYLESRMNLPMHSCMSSASTLNTLQYLFFHMKCGILVSIRNQAIVLFAPFVNKEYRNNWNDFPLLDCSDGSVDSYFISKGSNENYLQDKSRWWANGNIICNVLGNSDSDVSGNSGDVSGRQHWGDHFLFQLKDMIAETCRCRHVPDCDFFINKRDYPQLKFHPELGPVEPYGFIFDKDDCDPSQDIRLSRYNYSSFTPILSFYSSSRFADIPIPPSEDWEAATGQVFPATFICEKGENGEPIVLPPRDLFTSSNLQKFQCDWRDKVPTAFFRGTATGGGTTVDTNQRLHAAQLSFDWAFDPVLSGKVADNLLPASAAVSTSVIEEDSETGDKEGQDQEDQDDEDTKFNSITDKNKKGKSISKPKKKVKTEVFPPYLDAKITGWNMRDKKISSSRMTYVKRNKFKFSGDRATNFVEIYKQSRYKYLLYIEGHCAACRYGFMMLLGSVILKVDSLCVADQMWYFPLLQPYVDHVPVKSDMSDLRQQLEWCRTHDDECREIAANARRLYDQYICRDGILDYLQSVFVSISSRFIRPFEYGAHAPIATPPPHLPDLCTYSCGKGGPQELCSTCIRREEVIRLAKAATISNQTGVALKRSVKEEQEEKLRLRRERELKQVREQKMAKKV